MSKNSPKLMEVLNILEDQNIFKGLTQVCVFSSLEQMQNWGLLEQKGALDLKCNILKLLSVQELIIFNSNKISLNTNLVLQLNPDGLGAWPFTLLIGLGIDRWRFIRNWIGHFSVIKLDPFNLAVLKENFLNEYVNKLLVLIFSYEYVNGVLGI